MEACEFWSALSDDNDAHGVLQSHLATLIPSLISRLQLKEEQILQVRSLLYIQTYRTTHSGRYLNLQTNYAESFVSLCLTCPYVHISQSKYTTLCATLSIPVIFFSIALPSLPTISIIATNHRSSIKILPPHLSYSHALLLLFL